MNEINFKNMGLSKDILESIEKLGYKKPSEVQEKVIPLILKGSDVSVKSQTGSGKTAAYTIPICENIELEEKNPQALVLTPTRELALQVKEEFSSIGRFKRLRCSAVFGKEPFSKQSHELKQRVHVVCGTPGRTLDHIERGTLNLEKIKYLVIDEADEMLSMGFIDQVKAIIDNLPRKRITLLFSATMPDEILNLCSTYMNDPVNIEIKSKNTATKRISQTYYEVENNKKFELLIKIICKECPESSIIFCKTRGDVDELVSKLESKGIPCCAFHGGMLQKDRIDTIKKFKRGEFTFLVSTDIAARGIDVDDVTHIINYDIPEEEENYVHRIGRTGRFGKGGKAITFLTPYEHGFLEAVERDFGVTVEKGITPSDEEVQNGKEVFIKSLNAPHKIKISKDKSINSDITKIYISAGKKKKIRPGDIAGTISSIPGVNPEDIGIIDIQDNFSYVDVLSGKGRIVLEGLKSKTIKGKTVRSEIAHK